MSYMVAYGLGPYFQQATVKEIIPGNSYFTLHFDETVSAQVKKHMDLLVCYWSEESKEIKVRCLASITDLSVSTAKREIANCVLVAVYIPMELWGSFYH